MSPQPELYSCGGTYLIAPESTMDGLCGDAKDFLGSAVDIINDRMETLTPAEFGAFFLMQQTLAILEELSRRLENAKGGRTASGSEFMAGVSLAVQLLQHATREEGSGATSILAQDRGDASQSRFVLPYLLKLLQAPALCEGFAAVLSDYLVSVVSGSLHHSIYDGLTLARMGEQGRAGA